MNAPAIEDDPGCAVLLERLPREWASVPAETDGFVIAAAFIRAAYGRGYVAALEDGPKP